MPGDILLIILIGKKTGVKKEGGEKMGHVQMNGFINGGFGNGAYTSERWSGMIYTDNG